VARKTTTAGQSGLYQYRVRRLKADNADIIAQNYTREEPVPPGLAARLPKLLKKLIREEIILGGIVERRQASDGSWQVAAYGMATFLSPGFFAAHLKDPHPLLAIHVLERLALGHVRNTVLPPDELCRANAAGKPKLVLYAMCWHQDNYDFSSTDGRTLLEGAYRLLERHLSGYNLRAFLFEGRASYRHVSGQVGFTRLMDMTDDDRPEFAHFRADERYAPHLYGLFEHRGGPLVPGSPISRLFRFQPPVLRFSAAQKQVLQLALDNMSDQEIADVLDVPVNAVHMRWRKIYARVEKELPGFFGELEKQPPRARGREKRRRVLHHVREHPEELRPWCPPASRRRK